MLTRKSLFTAALATMLTAVSCSENFETASSETKGDLVPFEISVSLEPSTKTSFDGVSKVTWSPGDSIAVSAFESGAEIYSLTTEKGGFPAIFRGLLPAVTGKMKAFYPYSLALSNSSETNFKFKYPQTQRGKVGGVADNMLPMVAVTESLADSLIFHPICALAKVSVKGDDIKSVTLSLTPSSDGGYLWGDVINVSTDKWNTSTSKGSSEVILVPESGETFTPGNYFFTILTKTTADRTFSGVKISYLNTAGKAFERSSTNPITFARAKVYAIPGTEEDTYKGIFTASDLVAFADSVNSGKSIERFCTDGEVKLQSNIDMSEVTTWTPVGMPTSTSTGNTSCSYTGPSFKGVFNGNKHVIYNFKAKASVGAGSTFGLFGVLDGGTVKNLILGKEGDNSSVTVSASGTADAGVLVGVAYNGATIQDCVNNIPMILEGTTATANRFACGCFAGYACSTDKAVSLTNLVNNAPVKLAYGSNTGNGATGVMAGGIAGFCTGSGTNETVIESCENKGDLSGACGRSAGIAATMNAKTFMRYCVNRGNQNNTFVNGRIANLTCIMGTGSKMDDCTNYGDVVTSDASTTTAGMIGLLSNANVVVTGGGNYGKVIGANETYHGLLVANFSAFSSFSGVYAGGSCGTYSADGNHTMHELTKDSWMSHIGYYSPAALAKITDISSPWGTGGGEGGGSVPEFKDAALKILLIGNSFTKDAAEHLPGMIGAAGIKDVTIAHCYYGGRTIPAYNDGWSATKDYTLWYMNAGESKWTTFSDKVTLKNVAESGRWDIVTIQEHTGNYRAWNWTSAEKEAVQGLVSKCVATQKTAPKVYYIMSQAYYNMNKIGSGSKPYITWTDQAGMYKVIVEQTKKVLAETEVDDVLATGTMLQNLRTSGLDTDMNLTRDGYHMDYGIARYGAACVLFEKMISPKFGIKLDNNSFRYTTESTMEGEYSTPVSDKTAPIALKAARYAIEKPFEVTDMKGEGGGGGEDPKPAVLEGSGTQADPYRIAKPEEMKAMSSLLEEEAVKYFSLTADIDMSGIKDWTPVNTANKAVGIVFDGGNHTISNFSCTKQNYASIFGLVHGTIKNLKIDKPVVTHTSQCGIVATWLGNNNGSLSAKVQNVHITGATLSTSATAAASLGMIAANCGASEILDCSASGSITHGITASSWTYVGGLVGKVYVKGDIERCSFDGNITAKKGYGYGGIVGGSAADIPITVRNCWSAGSIKGVSYSGGIVGDLCKGSKVENCYSTMTIEGLYNLSGIVARTSNAKNSSSTKTFSTDFNITVKGCIAWNPSITSTNSASETPATHYSSGAVVGFTNYVCRLSSCLRRLDIAFKAYSNAELNVLKDTPDVSPEAPLVKTSTETYFCPYNGTVVSAGTALSAAAKTLSWDETIWDLSSDMPKLKPAVF